RSPFDLAALDAERYDAVLEVALDHHQLTVFDRLVSEVSLKLVEPRSGRVIGRARAYSMPSVERLDRLFADEARLYKDRFTHQAADNVGVALGTLRLAP